MNELESIIKDFENLDSWESFVKNNFERRAGLYTTVKIKEFRIEVDKEKYIYPRRILFESRYVKAKKIFNNIEKTIINGKKIKAVERTTVIPFGLYKRQKKYSGELVNIIKDIFAGSKIESCKVSNTLLQLGDTPLFNIDSKIDWPSYILMFNRTELIKKYDNIASQEDIDHSLLNEISSEYGINYSFNKQLEKLDFLIFKIPYLKIIENKIKSDEGDFEKLFFVLKYGDSSIFYTSKLDIRAKVLIKDINKEIVFDDSLKISFDKSKHQVLEVKPEKKCEIGYSSIELFINDTLVDKRSGYYIRSFKIDVKIK